MANDRLDALKKKRAQLNAQISKLSAQAEAQRRKDETRRKIVAGALLLDAVAAERGAGNGTALSAWWDAQLRELKRPQDRALFDVPQSAE